MNYPFPDSGLLSPVHGYGRGLLGGSLDDEFSRLRALNAQSPMLSRQWADQAAQMSAPRQAPYLGPKTMAEAMQMNQVPDYITRRVAAFWQYQQGLTPGKKLQFWKNPNRESELEPVFNSADLDVDAYRNHIKTLGR